jgi:hypothetical protein
VIAGVVRARRRLRMILYTKNRHLPVSNAFYGVIIEVEVGYL